MISYAEGNLEWTNQIGEWAGPHAGLANRNQTTKNAHISKPVSTNNQIMLDKSYYRLMLLIRVYKGQILLFLAVKTVLRFVVLKNQTLAHFI